MRLYGRASAPASSTKIVNVDDFEAKADGTDDSKVHTLAAVTNRKHRYPLFFS